MRRHFARFRGTSHRLRIGIARAIHFLAFATLVPIVSHNAMDGGRCARVDAGVAGVGGNVGVLRIFALEPKVQQPLKTRIAQLIPVAVNVVRPHLIHHNADD